MTRARCQFVQRIARPGGGATRTDVPGIVFLEIDGLALPCVRRCDAGRERHDHGALARGRLAWPDRVGRRISPRIMGEPRTRLGSNDDIPQRSARWTSRDRDADWRAPPPATALGLGGHRDHRHRPARRRRLEPRQPALGEAEEVILTVSRMEAERSANPGYRAFFANGFNVTRALVLFAWEVLLRVAPRRSGRSVATCNREGTAAALPARRDVRGRPRPDLFGVLSDMMRGRPAVYATFSSYDEVAHHSGLERADTLGSAAEARRAVRTHPTARAATRAAPTRSSCSPTTGRRRERRSSSGTATGSTSSSSARRSGTVKEVAGGDEQHSMVGLAVGEQLAEGRPARRTRKSAAERCLGPARGLGSGTSVHLIDGGAAQAHARRDQRAPSAADSRRSASTRTLAALLPATWHSAPRRALPRRAQRGRRGPARTVRTERATDTCCAPTGSHTSPTSWSAVSTTRIWKRGAPSRS